MNVGYNIKEIRERKGITQEELALKLHVTRQAVSNWENGKTSPSIDTLEELSEVLNVSLNKLLEVENLKKSHTRKEMILWGIIGILFILSVVLIIDKYYEPHKGLIQYEGTCSMPGAEFSTDERYLVFKENVNIVYEFGQFCVPVEFKIRYFNLDDENAKDHVIVTVPDEFDFVLKDFEGSYSLNDKVLYNGFHYYEITNISMSYTLDLNYTKRNNLYSHTEETSHDYEGVFSVRTN